MANLENVIVFVGPSLVGKTTIGKNCASLLDTNFVSSDTLCLNHNYHEEDAIELFDDLKDHVNYKNAKIIEIGSNTIENCTTEELEYLKKCLTINDNKPTFYLLIPTKDKTHSFRFLYSIAKKLGVDNSEFIDSLNDSLTTKSYMKLNPIVIETLEDFKQPSLNKIKRYQKHLEFIASNIALSKSILYGF